MRTLPLFLLALLATAPPFATPTLASVSDGSWSLCAPPASRSAHTVVVDPVRDQLVLFGGRSSTSEYLGDVWVQSLDGAPTWAPLAPTGSAPAARSGHASIHDPVRDRMIVFGGYNGSTFGDVRALTLGENPSWSLLLPSGASPGPRRYHAMVYDPLRDRALVFGGISGSVRRNDVWALSLGVTPAWTAITPAGTPPSARYGASAVFDPVLDRLLVFGGSDASGYRADVWALSLSGPPTWTLLAPAGTPPPPRTYAGATFDPATDAMIVFGGLGENAAEPGAWSLSLAGTPTWAAISPPGTAPPARGMMPLVLDEARRRLIVWGGSDGVASYSDEWTLDLDSSHPWFARAANWAPPPGLAAHDAIYDPLRERVLLFGGYRTTGISPLLNQVWALTPDPVPTWSLLAVSGGPPTGRASSTSIYDPVRDRMILYGGILNWPGADDLWALSLSGTPTWVSLYPPGIHPPIRSGHTAVLDAVRDRMLVFGGETSGGLRNNEVWALDLGGVNGWTQLNPTGTPPAPRALASAIVDPARDRMIVFGGLPGSYPSLEVFALSLADPPAWSTLAPDGPFPPARDLHTAVYDAAGDRMIVFGGDDVGNAYGTLNDTWALALDGNTHWVPLAPGGAIPEPRYGHAAAIDPVHARMFVNGGRVGPDNYFTNETRVLSWGTVVDAPPARPAVSALALSASPNPARGETTIEFTLPRAGAVSLGIHDVTGRLVCTLATGSRAAGTHRLRWDGRAASGERVAPGLYFCRLRSGSESATRKLARVE